MDIRKDAERSNPDGVFFNIWGRGYIQVTPVDKSTNFA